MANRFLMYTVGSCDVTWQAVLSSPADGPLRYNLLSPQEDTPPRTCDPHTKVRDDTDMGWTVKSSSSSIHGASGHSIHATLRYYLGLYLVLTFSQAHIRSPSMPRIDPFQVGFQHVSWSFCVKRTTLLPLLHAHEGTLALAEPLSLSTSMGQGKSIKRPAVMSSR